MLNIVNKSPQERNALQSCINSATGGALLLIEDGVYAAARGGSGEALLQAAQANFKLYALGPDLAARGILERVMEGVTVVDYGGFVELVTQHPTCQSWL